MRVAVFGSVEDDGESVAGIKAIVVKHTSSLFIFISLLIGKGISFSGKFVIVSSSADIAERQWR